MTPVWCLKHMFMIVADDILLHDILISLFVLNADFLQMFLFSYFVDRVSFNDSW